MNKTVLNRFVAYIIDAIFITLITMAISGISQIKSSQDRIDEVNKELNTLTEKYENKELDNDEYMEEAMVLVYKSEEYSVISNTASIILFLGYYVVFQWLNKGQTIGKKIMKIKIVSNNDKDLGVLNYLLRTLLLYGTLSTIVSVVCVYYMGPKTFYYTSTISSLVFGLLFYVCLFMMAFRQDGRGLHDILSNTKVISTKAVVEEEPIKEVIEKVEEEPKKVKTAKYKTSKKTKKK